MEKLEGTVREIDLKMANEDYYKQQAKFYRDSKAYDRMTELYPVLQTSINDCKEEKLID